MVPAGFAASGVPYWRLSLFYLFYFALLGGLVPYWGLYLKERGFDPMAIGGLTAVLMGSRILAPNFWGWLADRSGRRLRIVRLGALLTPLLFSGIFAVQGFWMLALVTLGFSFFWNAILPQFEVITLNALGQERDRYSLIRLWGSVGFIVTVIGLGALFERVSVLWLAPLLVGIMVLIWVSTLLVPGPSLEERSQEREGLGNILRRPEVLAFLLLCFLIQLGHGPYYAFFTLYMDGYGYSRSTIGLLWAWGVVAEVLLFLLMPRLIGGLGLRRLTILSMLVCALRWLLIALLPQDVSVMVFAQGLHAVTFGCLHAAAIALVQQFFGRGHQGQGQALYSSVGFGLGGALGALLSGWGWSQAGGASLFWAAALVSLLGAWVAWRWLHPKGDL